MKNIKGDPVMSKNIEKALAFIKSEFDASDYFKAHENEKVSSCGSSTK